MKRTAEEVQHASDYLGRILNLPAISEIATVCMGISRSGMQRRYMVLASDQGKVERISWAVAAITDMRFNRDEQSIVINGCGFNATQDIAYTLSRALGCKIGYREL
jgi:hypothetical protein